MNILQKIFRDHYEEIEYTLHPRPVVMENIEEINKYNMNISLSREVNDAVVNIKSAIISLDE